MLLTPATDMLVSAPATEEKLAHMDEMRGAFSVFINLRRLANVAAWHF